ncbi:DUF2252 domain-containing protein [Herminiimonas arsenitoxidans]|uniref:DUF2252 domain-containing protein n=1 Tax=Herminiimonas arsenitoxidans TaxID=1809410 RepID=UPI0009705B39|nr:DUF2252 domain-containing protein [Herminiimonas arsenitoxidans]
MKVVNRIRKANQGRDPERLAMKYAAMRTDAFVFLRGTCHLFYDRLPKSGMFKSSPLVWCCGDLHIENLGSYKGDNRLAYFDINDFDEAVLAPIPWELSRLIVSILVGVPLLGLSNTDANILAQEFITAYVDALATGKARWVERETSSGLVRELLEQVRLRSRLDFLNKRTQNKKGQRHFRVDGKKLLPISDIERHQIHRFMQSFARTQDKPEFYKVIDIARRVAGTGSLGVARYAILVEGKGSPNQNYLLDLKQALPSSIAKHLEHLQPKWKSHAERVVTLQKRMQAVSIAFLHAVEIQDQPYVLRALQPTEDRVPLTGQEHHIDHLIGVVKVMGECVAWAQLRSSGREGSAIADTLIDFSGRKKWRNNLLSICHELADQVQDDWRTYCEAYDAGLFGPGEDSLKR